ncbi:MAG: hypothetical protein ACOYMN_01065 [Roseimicrobium sp.]
MHRVFLSFALALSTLPVCGAGPTAVHYFDETTNRHLTVTHGDFDKISILIRFVGIGSSARWLGDGARKDKEITFAQTVGEDQERGTFFIAKGGESKLEISFKPGQRMPQDAGINGVYRHITDEKRLSLAKKEFAAAEEALETALKTAPKSWPSEDRPVAGEWKNRWSELRKQWLRVSYKAPTPAAPATAAKPALGSRANDGAPEERLPEYWVALSETTGMALGFLGAPLDKLIPQSWDGEYDDSFGGHVSIRVNRDGMLRFNLTCTRGSGDGQTGDLSGKIAVSTIKKEKNGDFLGSYTHQDPELKPEDPPATVSLRKVGHFLFVETQHTERYRGRAWFDGIYRWSPVPKE